MKTLNPRHIDAIIHIINNSPYFSLLSLQVRVLEYGYCKLEVDLQEKHLNPFGGIHGGVYSSAIDTAAYWASYGSVGEDAGLISLDLHVDNISAIQTGKLIIEGQQIKAGRTICLSESTIKDINGKLLAYGTSKQSVTTGVQTINQAIAVMGLEPLPAKFIHIGQNETSDRNNQDMDASKLTRNIHDIPDYVAVALDVSGLWERYRARPPYQRNDYIGWINRAKREETRHKRLQQMLYELRSGDAYMGMKYKAK
jgi:uncharacterized protein (TIGR00369 family)